MTKTKDNILKSAVEEKVQKPAPQAPVISPQQEEEVKQEMQQTMQENLQKPTASAEVLQTKPAPKPEPKTYSEMFDIINPYTPPTAEELETERRKRRSKAVVKALGDGLSSLANIYFTSKGAPAVKYDPRGSLSERGKARWDALDKMRDANMTRYATDKMKVMEADIRQKNAEELQKTQLEAQAKAAKQAHEYKMAQIAAQAEADAQQKKLANDFTAEQNQVDRESREKINKQNNQTRQVINANTQENLNKRAQATAAKGVRGKHLGFSDGQGNHVSIYENVWKPSMQQVYNALIEDGIKPTWEEKEESGYRREDFIKQNWAKSPKARAIMMALSQIDPATMQSNIQEEEEDYSQYLQQDEEDYSQYEQK